ncbi:MAG: magnesium/cobalt transporter CorA [Candidatus Micrarchaeia archaeon]
MGVSRVVGRRSGKAGLPPGTIVYVGDKKSAKTWITVIDYDEKSFSEKVAKEVSECFALKGTPTTSWINVDGVHDISIIEEIGRHYDIHPLILEDIAHTGQRPKYEDLGGYIYIVLNMLTYDEVAAQVRQEQVSMILRGDCLITFQESEGKSDVFDGVRERIRSGTGQIRKMGTDYLAYSLIDAIVDNYFTVLERLGERVDTLEARILANPSPAELHEINRLKHEVLLVRRSVWPLREVLSALERSESPLIKERTRIYLKDAYDHTIQVMDMVESMRDILSEMVDVHLSGISNRLNEIMKVLTIISTVFIPLTFIAGVYGMNFRYMPELESEWGYPAVLLLMLLVAALMVLYFRRRRWL